MPAVIFSPSYLLLGPRLLRGRVEEEGQPLNSAVVSCRDKGQRKAMLWGVVSELNGETELLGTRTQQPIKLEATREHLKYHLNPQWSNCSLQIYTVTMK